LDFPEPVIAKILIKGNAFSDRYPLGAVIIILRWIIKFRRSVKIWELWYW